MHMIKVPGSFHDDEITAIDVSPCNGLVVTGGKDGNCNVWDRANLVAKSKLISPTINDFQDLKISKVLYCNVANRASITCIRFGNLLSNASKFVVSFDNGEIYMFELLSNGDFTKNLLFKLPEPVIEMTFSMDDELLAVCGHHHSTITIFDVRFNEALTRLNDIHAPNTSVKGLQFDKRHGRYLCSLGDDKLVSILEFDLVWNNAEEQSLSTTTTTTKRRFNYKLTQKFNKLITQNTLNSKVTRIDFSPDDKAISIPNSNKGKMSLISVLLNKKPAQAQGDWQNWCSLVGHNFNCEVTKFNPKVFYNQKEKHKTDPYYIIASSGSDKTLAIWNTSAESPIIVAQDITTGAVLDLCWSIDGSAIFITSTKGEFLVISFNEEELGTVINTAVANRIVKDWDSELAVLQSSKKQQQAQAQESEQKQKQNQKAEPATRKGPAQALPTPPPASAPIPAPAPTPAHAPSTTSTKPEIDSRLAKQKVVTKNGKKRVAPMLVTADSRSTTTTTAAPTISSLSNRVNTLGNNNSMTTMEFDQPTYVVPRSISQQTKRVYEDPETLANKTNKRPRRELEPIEFIGSVVINPSNSFSNVRLSIPKIRKYWEHESPNNESLYLAIKNGNGNESGPSKIQLFKRNQLGAVEGDSDKEVFFDFIPKKILLSSGGEGLFWALATIEGTLFVYSDSGKRILPPIVLGTPISFLESKGDYLMAVTSLGEIFAWNVALKKAIFEPTSLFPLLQPLQNASSNKSNSADGGGPGVGGTGVGDDDHNDSAHQQQQQEELYENDLLARAENLTLCSITSQGVPIITLSNGNGYIYDKDMCTWSLVSDSWWAFGSQYWDNTLISSKRGSADSANIISMLEKHTNEEIIRKGKNKFFNKISKIMLMKEGFENLENIISINHLENKILIYRYLKDFKNFKYFLMIYVKKLIEMNFVNRIYDIILNLKETEDQDNDIKEILNEIVMLNPKLNDFIKSV